MSTEVENRNGRSRTTRQTSAASVRRRLNRIPEYSRNIKRRTTPFNVTVFSFRTTVFRQILILFNKAPSYWRAVLYTFGYILTSGVYGTARTLPIIKEIGSKLPSQLQNVPPSSRVKCLSATERSGRRVGCYGRRAVPVPCSTLASARTRLRFHLRRVSQSPSDPPIFRRPPILR